MAIFYTVSYGEFDSTTIELFKDYSLLRCCVLQDFYNGEEVDEVLIKQFPYGLSAHGLQYVTNPIGQFIDNVWRVEDSQLLEVHLEFVRRLYYPNRPSRFASLFGTEDLKSAQQFNRDYRKSSGTIYKVEASEYYKVDMNWLKMGSTYAGINVMANKYWEGQSTLNPFWEILLQCPVTVLEKVN